MNSEFSNCTYFQPNLVCPYLPALHGHILNMLLHHISSYIKPGHHLYWLSIFSFNMTLCLAQLKCPLRSHSFSLVSQILDSGPKRARDAPASSSNSSSVSMASTLPAVSRTRTALAARPQVLSTTSRLGCSANPWGMEPGFPKDEVQEGISVMGSLSDRWL